MKTSRKQLLQALVALFVMLTVNTTEVLVVGAESESTILNFVSKLAYSASTINIVDIMTWVGIFALIMYVYRDEPFKLDITGLAVAVILAFLYIWCFSYKLTQDTSALFANSFQCFLTIVRFCGFTILFYVGFAWFYSVLKNIEIKNNGKSVKVFIISSLIVFFGWLFWLIMAYPGTVAWDGVTQLEQYYFKDISAHHPPFSTWIMGVLFDIGNMITHDGRFGVFLYLLVQAVMGAVIIGYSIYTIYLLGISRVICYIISVVFGFAPVFGILAQWYEKDLMYGIVTLLFLTRLVKACFEEISVKDIIILSLTALFCIFLRNNGIYAVIPALLALILLKKEKLTRIILAGCTFGIVVITLIIQGPVFDSAGIEPTRVREALSIPMQQSARYIIEYGDEVTPEEREVLGAFFNDYDAIPGIYNHFCSDPVKNTVVDKPDLPHYFATWFKMGFKQPGVYMDAFMCLNYGYLAPTEQNAEANGDMPNQGREGLMAQLADMGVDGTQDDENTQILKNLIFINMVFPIVRYMTMPGVYMWFMIITVAICIKLKDKRGYVLIIPNVINLLVCLASPLCNAMRYQLPVVLSVPLMITVMAVLMKKSYRQ